MFKNLGLHVLTRIIDLLTMFKVLSLQVITCWNYHDGIGLGPVFNDFGLQVFTRGKKSQIMVVRPMLKDLDLLVFPKEDNHKGIDLGPRFNDLGLQLSREEIITR